MQFDENKLISLMENFSGAKFQWIKTNRPELLGKVVTCRTIEPRGNSFFAVFNDGSSVDTTQLNTSLLMLHGDMQPLSKEEVDSIAGPRRPAQAQQSSRITSQDQTAYRKPEPATTAQPRATNMFEMFNSEEGQIDLKLTLRLPDQTFLKMMYANAKDKDNFLGELSDYVFAAITKTIVKDSIESMVIPENQAVSRTKPTFTVNITEIHED